MVAVSVGIITGPVTVVHSCQLSPMFVCCSGDGRPTIFVAVAGRSNGLGPTVSGNTSFPVINCPPLSADWAAQDIWSSLRLPSGRCR